MKWFWLRNAPQYRIYSKRLNLPPSETPARFWIIWATAPHSLVWFTRKDRTRVPSWQTSCSESAITLQSLRLHTGLKAFRELRTQHKSKNLQSHNSVLPKIETCDSDHSVTSLDDALHNHFSWKRGTCVFLVFRKLSCLLSHATKTDCTWPPPHLFFFIALQCPQPLPNASTANRGVSSRSQGA